MHAPRWSLLLLLCVAQLMVILDISAVNVALPDLAKDLDIAPADIGWTITSYSLVFGSLLLLGGRAADLLGRRRVFLTGLGVFTAASLASALAGDADDAVRRPRRSGPGRGDALAGGAVDHHHRLRRPRARQGARRLGRGRRRRRRDRRPARRRADRARRLARDLLHQPARRPRRRRRAVRLVPADAARPRWRGLDLRGALLATASLGALVYALSQAADSRLDVGADARPRRGRAGGPRRVRRARAAHRPAAPARPAPARPRRRRRLRDDARRRPRSCSGPSCSARSTCRTCSAPARWRPASRSCRSRSRSAPACTSAAT